MSDFEKQLKDLLEENWALTGDLAKSKIDFHYGYKTPDQILKPQVQVGYFRHSQILHSAEDDIEGDAELSVTLIYKAKLDSPEEIESAKANRVLMRDEVERILGISGALPSEWEYAFVSSFENADLADEEPPIIRAVLNVMVKYIKT